MEDFTEAPVSRYFQLSEEKRIEPKRRQKARYWQNADSIRRRCYQRVLGAGKIKCPNQSTLEKYDLLLAHNSHPLRKPHA